jgi:hypothetical protein
VASVGVLLSGFVAVPCLADEPVCTQRLMCMPEVAPENAIALDLGLHVVGIGYQRTLSKRVALFGAADWYVPWTQTKTLTATTGGVLRVRPFFYLTKDAPRGVWVSPFLQAGFANAEGKTGFAGALGGSVGYSFLLAEHIYLAVGIGAQVHAVRIRGARESSFFRPFVHIDAIAGYAF